MHFPTVDVGGLPMHQWLGGSWKTYCNRPLTIPLALEKSI